MGVRDCQLIEFPVIHAPEGNLTFVEGQGHIPFDIARVYYIYDVPAGASRGAHAHRSLRQLLIALSGSFDVRLDDGVAQRTVSLTEPHRGLLLAPMIWRELIDFSDGAVCMVLASAAYDESDYVRSHDEFLTIAAAADG